MLRTPLTAFFIFFFGSLGIPCAAVGAQTTDTLTDLAWSTDSTQPARFVSVHGRRSAAFGYSQEGLEVWAYPFQIVSSYKVAFRPQGTTTVLEGQGLLRRIIYSPEAVSPGRYRLVVAPSGSDTAKNAYEHDKIQISFVELR